LNDVPGKILDPGFRQSADRFIALTKEEPNGPGAIDIKAGKGSVIIDAWCSILGSVKEIEN